MSNDADITMMLYANLLPEEKSVLKAMESSLLKILLAHSITARPIWTAKTTSDGRVIQLLVGEATETKMLLELPAANISNISEDDIASKLVRSIE